MNSSRERMQAVYNAIADHFSKTRAYPWPEVTEFLDGKSGSWGLDIGCGNGRHLEPLAACTTAAVGVDLSPVLVGQAADRIPEGSSVIAGDASQLPIRTNSVDIGLYVATLHHLPNRNARQQSLDELARVLSEDGIALVSVWSTAHDRFDRSTGFDTTIEWTLPDGRTVPRYYHIYDHEEFVDTITASNLELVASELSSGNCYAQVRSE